MFVYNKPSCLCLAIAWLYEYFAMFQALHVIVLCCTLLCYIVAHTKKASSHMKKNLHFLKWVLQLTAISQNKKRMDANKWGLTPTW